MMIFAAAVVYFAYVTFDFMSLFRTKKKRYILPCIALFGIGAVIQLLYELKVDVPSPSPVIVEFFTGWFDID